MPLTQEVLYSFQSTLYLDYKYNIYNVLEQVIGFSLLSSPVCRNIPAYPFMVSTASTMKDSIGFGNTKPTLLTNLCNTFSMIWSCMDVQTLNSIDPRISLKIG